MYMYILCLVQVTTALSNKCTRSLLLDALPNFFPISAAFPLTNGPPRLELRKEAAGTPASSDLVPTWCLALQLQ